MLTCRLTLYPFTASDLLLVTVLCDVDVKNSCQTRHEIVVIK